MLDSYTSSIMNITFNEENNNLHIIFLSKKYTKEELYECQNIINKYYHHAAEKNIKYNLFFNINSLYYNDVKYLSINDYIHLYNINIINTEKYIENVYIITDNYWQRSFIKFFLYFYKIKVNIYI